MCRNEKGFSFAEGMLALSLVMLIAVTLFPLCLKMLGQLQTVKEEMTASRLLYEFAEGPAAAFPAEEERRIGDAVYRLHTGSGEGGGRFACVETENIQKCVGK